MKTPLPLFIGSILFFFILYFGFSKVSPEIRNPEKSGALKKVDTDLNQLVQPYRDSLKANERGVFDVLEQKLQQAVSDSAKQIALEEISGFWYKLGNVGLAAEYAQKLAELFPSGDRWAIAATNFILAAKQPNAPDLFRSSWIEKAKAGFAQAQLVEPENLNHQVNLALINVDYPPQDQPMTGILQLRALNEKFPDNVSVLYHLARLAIQTNQWDKAKERLNTILKLKPDFERAYCLMIEVAKHENDLVTVKSLSSKCNSKN